MPAVPRILGGHILPSRASWQDERTHGQTAKPVPCSPQSDVV
jgi:hypothetical protein